jgi:hypothetical protein
MRLIDTSIILPPLIPLLLQGDGEEIFSQLEVGLDP